MLDPCGVVNNSKTEVDVVEVVRCKNCVHYNVNNCADGFGWCDFIDRGEMDDNFCSYGERKDT